MEHKLEHYPDHFCRDSISHPSHAKPGIHPFPDKLYVVTVLENPLRWRARYANYWKFERHVADAGAVLYTCEVAFGDRCFEVTQENEPRHIQLRTRDEVWHKENAQNIALSRLPVSAKKVAFIDADMIFSRSDWAQECLHLLEHYPVLQMFSHLIDVDPEGRPIGNAVSMAYMRQEKLAVAPHENAPPPRRKIPAYPYPYAGVGKWGWGAPGGAWAWRKEALDHVGGLIDWIISGSADYYMAKALHGEIEDILRPDYSEPFKDMARHWQERAVNHIKFNIGHMPGALVHYFHGPKSKRGYEFRPDFIAKTKFDPLRDIKRDWQGLYQLKPERVDIRDGLRYYNRLRNEDATL